MSIVFAALFSPCCQISRRRQGFAEFIYLSCRLMINWQMWFSSLSHECPKILKLSHASVPSMLIIFGDCWVSGSSAETWLLAEHVIAHYDFICDGKCFCLPWRMNFFLVALIHRSHALRWKAILLAYFHFSLCFASSRDTNNFQMF